jgi:Ubiquitin-2 like Rad60 SUMO-like
MVQSLLTMQDGNVVFFKAKKTTPLRYGTAMIAHTESAWAAAGAMGLLFRRCSVRLADVQLVCRRKLMAAYCNKSSIDVESVAFIFDGQRIRGDQTPGDLDMEDQDEIEVSCCRSS